MGLVPFVRSPKRINKDACGMEILIEWENLKMELRRHAFATELAEPIFLQQAPRRRSTNKGRRVCWLFFQPGGDLTMRGQFMILVLTELILHCFLKMNAIVGDFEAILDQAKNKDGV